MGEMDELNSEIAKLVISREELDLSQNDKVSWVILFTVNCDQNANVRTEAEQQPA